MLNCPTGLASPENAARAVASLAQSGRIAGKPVLTCWLGERAARDGRRVLVEAGVVSYETPEDVAAAVSHSSEWSRAQKALMRVPANRSQDVVGDRDKVLAIFRQAAGEGRRMLTSRSQGSHSRRWRPYPRNHRRAIGAGGREGGGAPAEGVGKGCRQAAFEDAHT